MEKIEIGKSVFPYPMPVAIIGCTVKEQANFITIAWLNRVNASPTIWMVAINKRHYSPIGIRAYKTFSINFPGADLMEKTDYCGIVSGHKTDKSTVFEVFYGKLKTAPMIRECPLNIECSLSQIIELPTNLLVLGEVEATYTEERYITDGQLDIKKINPLLLTMPDNTYWSVGAELGKAWSIGKKYTASGSHS